MASTVLIATRSAPLAATNATNSTTAGTSIANPADTLTKPSGDGVIDFAAGFSHAMPRLLLIPFGVGSAGNTFLMSVFGWDYIANGQVGAWTARLLASFTCTLGTGAGISGSAVNASQLYCDTITLGKGGTAGVSQEIRSPTGNVTASAWVDCGGSALADVRYAINASATSANALARRF